jgi:hypothetical protein
MSDILTLPGLYIVAFTEFVVKNPENFRLTPPCIV